MCCSKLLSSIAMLPCVLAEIGRIKDSELELELRNKHRFVVEKCRGVDI